MKVRMATEADIPKIVEMGLAFYNDTQHARSEPYSPEAVEKMTRWLLGDEKRGAAFVAHTDAGEIVGATAGMLYPLWMAPNHITGQEMFWYVMPEHRKSRAGSLLFSALEDWASKNANSFCMIALSHLAEKRIGKMYEAKGFVALEKSYVKAYNKVD